MDKKFEDEDDEDMRLFKQDVIRTFWWLIIVCIISFIVFLAWKPISLIVIAALPFLIGYAIVNAYRRGR